MRRGAAAPDAQEVRLLLRRGAAVLLRRGSAAPCAGERMVLLDKGAVALGRKR